MSKKCRIMSIIAIGVSVIVIICSIITIVRKQKDKDIYATSIKFNGIVRGVELCIDNGLIIDRNMVEVNPSNCTFTPYFSIQKSTEKESEYIDEGVYFFDDTGTYYLSCLIKGSKDYSIKDFLRITVVEYLRNDNSGMCITPHKYNEMNFGDVVDLSSLMTLTMPNNANMNITCSEHLSFNDNKFTALKSGRAKISVNLNYDCITITNDVYVTIDPPPVQNNIRLKLTVGGTVLTNNVINIVNDGFDFVFNYTLENIDRQQITCRSSDDSIVQVVSHYSPEIIITPKSSGTAILYISSIYFPDTIFEVIVNVN